MTQSFVEIFISAEEKDDEFFACAEEKMINFQLVDDSFLLT